MGYGGGMMQGGYGGYYGSYGYRQQGHMQYCGQVRVYRGTVAVPRNNAQVCSPGRTSMSLPSRPGYNNGGGFGGYGGYGRGMSPVYHNPDGTVSGGYSSGFDPRTGTYRF